MRLPHFNCSASYIEKCWQGDPLHSEYSVQYREQGQTDWYGQRTITPQVQINNLKPGTTYEYHVQATCGIISSDYSAVSRATTAEEAVGQFVCGAPSIPQPPPPQPLLQFLAPNDVIYYHKFKIITKSVTSSAGGRFSGEGIAEIPFLNYSSIRVNFVGIAVTQSRVVVGGIVESIYNPNSKVIYVTDKPLQEGAGQNQNGQGTPAVEVINFPGTIAAVTVNDKGEIVVKGADGNETVYKRAKDAKTGKPKEAVVADAAGNSYSVDKDGKVTKGANTGNTNASADARGIKFPLFVIYGHDLDKTIYYCASAALDAKTKNELEASIKEKLKTSTWSDMPESQVVFNNDCSIAYTDNLSVRRGAVVYSEQNKKVFFADLSKDYDFAWKLNGSDYTPGASLQEADLKKGNNSLELEVLTKSSAGLHAKVTLQINYGKFDINNYRVKVVRNGRPYYYKDQQFVGKENGEIPLKEDEAIQLTLEQKDEQTSWKLLENVEWMLSHSEDSKVVNTTLPLVFTETFTHDYVVAKIPSTTEAFRVDFRKETYELAPPNPITKPDVTRLATNLQAKREDLFNWAMNTIQTKNTTLYSSITGERASTKVYIVPVNDADFTGLTSGINGNVKGVTNFLYRERVDYFPLLSTVNPQLSGSVIVSATLITKLSDKEKEEIIKAISAKMKTDQYEFFYGKVKAYSGESGAMLDKAMADGAIAPDELDKLVYKVGAEDVNKFIDLVSSTKDVYLNDANIKTASDNSSEPFERTFIKTLAHELTHIHFKATSKLDYLTWEIIRKNKNGQYDLKDQLGNNCGCSAGPGHECHNPENSAVCGEENNYNTVKRSK